MSASRARVRLSRRGLLVAAAALAAPSADAADAVEEVASGLRFPEGPVAMADGSVLLCEIAAGCISRIRPGGRREVVALTGGGPNGAAIGPDGALYVANNGGFSWSENGGLLLPGHRAADYAGGRIERVDLRSGKVTVLYKTGDGVPLVGPNDLVFDASGGMWISDAGHSLPDARLNGGVFYATADGKAIKRVLYPFLNANGIGLSPDGKTLYVALTLERHILAFDVIAPGVLKTDGLMPGRVVASAPGRTYFDSLRVDAAGNVCVATLLDSPGVRTYAPDGRDLGTVPVPDVIVTSLCFGGKDLRDVHITGGTKGKLFRARWERPGLRLNFQKA
jgi:gluconolactonase